MSTFTELGGALAQGQSVRDIAAGLAAPSGATAARRRIGDHPYERRVEEIVAARGCSVFEAIRIVKRHDPELCLEYCERQR